MPNTLSSWITRYALCALLSLCCIAQAQVQAPSLAPQAPEIAAHAYLLVDVTAQQVLAQSNADQPVEPASLTKLMSAYLVFQAVKAKKITLSKPCL